MSALIGNPLLLTSAPAAGDSEYQIERSLRFTDTNDGYLKKTFGKEGNRRTWTYSCWMKHSLRNDGWWLIGSGNTYFQVVVSGTESWIRCNQRTNGGNTWWDSGRHINDPSAWYNIVIAVDYTQSTNADKIKLYINGILDPAAAGALGKNYVSTDTELLINQANDHYIGSNSNPDGGGALLSDVYFIDGQQLHPSAFGKYNSKGIWVPKDISLPAPNNGTTWSTYGTWSGDSSTDRPNAFDGSLSTYHEASSNNTSMIWTPTEGLPITTSLRLYLDVNGTHYPIKINDKVVLDHNETSDGWNDIPGAGISITSLDKLDIKKGGVSYAKLAAIEIDGVILVDGITNTTAVNNPNDGRLWSGELSASGGFDGSYPATKAFNGLADSGDRVQTASTDTPIVWSTSIDVKNTISVWSGKSTWKYQINDSGSYTTVTNHVERYKDIPFTGTLTNLKIMHAAAGEDAGFNAIKIDGFILVDSTDNHSVGFKFNDITKNRYLGKDTLNGKIADATGGLPIYNTTDLYGDVKGSGYRTDSNSSNLLLALAGDTLTDIHATIKGSGSNRTATATGDPTVVTDQSRFYGNSIHFDGNDALRFPDSTDFDFGTGAVTVEVWCRPNSTGGDQYILNWGNPTNEPSNSWTGINIYSGEWRIGCFNNLKYQDNYGLRAKQWTHIAMTRNGSNLWIHINGVLVSTQNIASAEWNCNTVISVGSEHNGTSHPFTGHIQDLRIYGAAKYTSANFKPPTRNDWTATNFIETNPKNNTIASSSETGYTRAKALSVLFDGDDDKALGDDYSIVSTSGTSETTITLGTAVSGNLQVRVHNGNNQVDGGISVDNGSNWTTVPTNGTNWVDMGTVSNLTILKIRCTFNYGGGSTTYWKGIKVDGVLISTKEAGEKIDSLTDSPTNYGTDTGAGGEVRGNYCTWNPLNKTLPSPTNGNLNSGTAETAGWRGMKGTFGITTGKWYYEAKITGQTSDASNGYYIGLGTNDCANNSVNQTGQYTRQTDTTVQNGSYNHTDFTVPAVDEIHGIAVDMDAKKMWISTDGTWEKSGNPATGANPHITIDSSHNELFPFVQIYGSAISMECNFGQRPWAKTCPSGFKALCTQNLPNLFDSEDSENDPSKYFDVALYTGNGDATDGNTISGLPFQPDLVWIKRRDANTSHMLYDAVRGFGVNKALLPNGDYAMGDTTGVTESAHGFLDSITSDGFVVKKGSSTGVYTNQDNSTYVSWNWDCGTAASGANNDGTVNVSSGNQWVNGTAGFSITKYTGDNAVGGSTVGHGLSAKPKLVIVKRLDAAQNWIVWVDGLTSDKNLYLHTNGAEDTPAGGYIDDALTTNEVVKLVGNDGGNGNTNYTTDYIMYCWTPIPGYSAFGTYSGQEFVYTGFRPKYVTIKTAVSSSSWHTHTTYPIDKNNPVNIYTRPDLSNAEATDSDLDIYSNGFFPRATGTWITDTKMVYIAFAEHPFKLARAR